MTDKNDKPGSLLSRAVRRAQGLKKSPSEPVLEVGSRRRKLARKVASKARQAVQRIPVQAATDSALRMISDPRVTQVLQAGLRSAGNVGMEATFAREPDARLLFEYASWCDEEAGRGQIMGLLMQDAMSPQGGFFQLYRPLMDLGAVSDPLAALAAGLPGRGVTETLVNAQLGALRTLCTMGAVATKVPAPDALDSLEELAVFFADLELPSRFSGIADLALGLSPSPPPSTNGNVEAPTSESDAKKPAGALVRSLPPGLRFVMGPYLLFLQFYLTRNMVDALPNVMSKVREELVKDEPEVSPAGDPSILDMDG